MKILRRKPRKIAVQTLKSLDACDGEIQRFEQLWPDGAKVMLKNVLIADRELNLGWFISHLPAKLYREFWNKLEPILTEKSYAIATAEHTAKRVGRTYTGQLRVIRERYCKARARLFVRIWNEWQK